MTHILIVDDKEENLHFLETLLTRQGYTVVVALNGEEALVKARLHPPELVVSDLMMPVMDGYTLLQHWKADKQFKQIPFIVYTANFIEEEDQRYAHNLGADAFILKPIRSSELLARIKAVMSKGTVAQPLASSTVLDEKSTLKNYSELLVRKLEAKTGQLEQSNLALQLKIDEQLQTATLLQLEHARLLAAQRIANLGSWETDLPSMNVIWSEQLHRIFETDPASFSPTHASFLSFVHPDDLELVDAAFKNSQTRQETSSIEHRLLLPSGKIKFVEENWQVYQDAEGKPVRALGTCRDITERKATQDQLAYLNRVRAVFTGISALILRASNREVLFRDACHIAYKAGEFRMVMLCMINPDTQLIEPVASEGKDTVLLDIVKNALVNEVKAEQTMVARAIKSGQAIVANDCKNDPQVLFKDHYLAHGVQSLAVLPLIKSKDAFGALVLYAQETDFFQKQEMTLLSELANDIAFAVDQLEKQERLEYLANYDTLTGLANRGLFLQRLGVCLDEAARTGDKLGICLTNLDRFKNINDTLGRASGDVLLRLVSEWLIRTAESADMASRIGADHFAVIFHIKPQGNLIKLFESLSRSFQENQFMVNDTALRISAKAGIALFPDDGTDADTLFRNAEAALKEAKFSNERFLFYTKDMNLEVASRLMLENQLRQAMSNHEFELYYQPKVNLESGMIIGAEALLRWNHPEGNVVLPAMFIPILEETGMIADVGRRALDQAINVYLRWRKAGLPVVPIAVNVSPLQLNNRSFLAELESRIGVDSLAAAGLELEITESVVMENIKSSSTSLQAIRAMGISVAIDDFGTGFSSLSYLAKLPVDSLKIDRSFVQDMTSGSEGLALISMIIGLAHALNLKVVAEGVETAEQLRLLRLLRCDEIQGYVISRPLPEKEFEQQFLRGSMDMTSLIKH